MADGASGSFKTHANYLRASAVLAGDQIWPLLTAQQRLEGLATRAAALASMADPPPATQDLPQIKSSLENAWGTELLLGLAGHFRFSDDVVRLTNNWGVVQAYYVTYHATQAYSVAKGQPRPDSHPKTQNEFGARWLQRPLQLAPWTFGVCHAGFLNVPPGTLIDPTIHAWSACTATSAWSLAAKAFQSTRDSWVSDAEVRERKRLQSQRRKAWRDSEAKRIAVGRPARPEPTFALPRLDPASKPALHAAIRPAGLIDYLYRLRIKTNYEDSSMFTDGPDDDQASSQVHRDLTFLATSTLLVHELHIGRLIGKPALLGWIDQWMTAHLPSGMSVGLGQRRPVIDSTL